jgi:CRISPR-associated endonuclease Cas3-HD
MVMEAIAHLTEDGRVHSLNDHLRGTARLAGLFAEEFGCGEWGRTLGLWHDLGKYSEEFQHYIRAACGIDAPQEGNSGRVDHSAAGALHAVACFNKLGRVFAYPIAGHHAGLADWLKLIDEKAQAPVIVQYRNEELIESLCRSKPERGLMRKLQRSVVNLPRHLHGKLLASGAIREVHPGIFLQGHGALYQEDLGFCPDRSIVYEPVELFC